MNDRPVRTWLADARYYAGEAHRIGHALDHNASDRDYPAIRYCLVVVGEALSEVPWHISAEVPTIPWRQIIALRHRLVHSYWLIDINIIMDAIHNEIQALLTALNQLIEKIE